MPEQLDREALDELLRLAEESIPARWELGIIEDTPGERYIVIGGNTALFARLPDIKHPHYDFCKTAKLIVAMRNSLVSLIELAREGLAAREELELATFMFENKVWAVPESYGWRLRIGNGGHNVEYEFERLFEHNGHSGAFADPFTAIDEYRKWTAARQALTPGAE